MSGIGELFPNVPVLDARPLKEAYPKTMRCPECGDQYEGEEVPIAFYWRSDAKMHLRIDRPRCRLCALEVRHATKHKDIYRHKARDATRREYQHKYKDLSPNLVAFCRRFGWVYDRMAADIDAAFRSTCCYCGLTFSELSDVTIDIFDPRQLPYYGHNTRWPCATCNRAKTDMNPHEFAIWCGLWRRRGVNRFRIAPSPPSLFDNLGAGDG